VLAQVPVLVEHPVPKRRSIREQRLECVLDRRVVVESDLDVAIAGDLGEVGKQLPLHARISDAAGQRGCATAGCRAGAVTFCLRFPARRF
jgi:hypothetical protein